MATQDTTPLTYTLTHRWAGLLGAAGDPSLSQGLSFEEIEQAIKDVDPDSPMFVYRRADGNVYARPESATGMHEDELVAYREDI